MKDLEEELRNAQFSYRKHYASKTLDERYNLLKDIDLLKKKIQLSRLQQKLKKQRRLDQTHEVEKLEQQINVLLEQLHLPNAPNLPKTTLLTTALPTLPTDFKSILLSLFLLTTIAFLLFLICFAIQLLEYQKNKNNFDKNVQNSSELDSEICHNMPNEVFKYSVADTYVEIYSRVFDKERKAVIETIRDGCSEYLKINPEPDIDDSNSFVNTMKSNFKELGSIKDTWISFMNQLKNSYDGIRSELSNSASSLGFIADIGIVFFGILKIFYLIVVNFVLLIVMIICEIMKKLFIVIIAVLIAACSLGPFSIIPCLILLAILIVPIIFLAMAIAFFCVFVVNAILLLLVAKVGYQVRTKSFH